MGEFVAKGYKHMLILDKSLDTIVDKTTSWIGKELGVWKEVKDKRDTSDCARRPDAEKFMIEDELWQTYVGRTSPENIIKGQAEGCD